MQEHELKAIAAQCRKPEGDMGKNIAIKMAEGNALINQSAIDALNLKKGSHILELGMANGVFMKDIVAKESSIRYTGCDYSEDMLKAANDLNQSFIDSGQVSFHYGTADNLPLPDSQFDEILTVNTLYFWDEPDKVLQELYRVLKKNGQIVIAVRSKETLAKAPFIKYGFHLFSKEDIQGMLDKNGFQEIKIVEKSEPPQEIAEVMVDIVTWIISAKK